MKTDRKPLMMRDTMFSALIIQIAIILAYSLPTYLFSLNTPVTDIIGGLIIGLFIFGISFLLYVFYKGVATVSILRKVLYFSILLIASSFSYGIGVIVPIGVPSHKVVNIERFRDYSDDNKLEMRITTNATSEDDLLKITNYRIRVNGNKNKHIRTLFYREGDNIHSVATVGIAIATDGEIEHCSINSLETENALRGK